MLTVSHYTYTHRYSCWQMANPPVQTPRFYLTYSFHRLTLRFSIFIISQVQAPLSYSTSSLANSSHIDRLPWSHRYSCWWMANVPAQTPRFYPTYVCHSLTVLRFSIFTISQAQALFKFFNLFPCQLKSHWQLTMITKIFMLKNG